MKMVSEESGGFKNKAFQTLEAVIDKLQELEKSILKSTVSRQ